MPSPYDITQIFSRQYGYEPRDVILDLNELINDIEDDNWKKQLKEEELDYADRTKSCPKCGEPLEIINQWKESRGEMLGKEVYENIYTYGCTKCNYIKD